jgi:hypothetical protein
MYQHIATSKEKEKRTVKNSMGAPTPYMKETLQGLNHQVAHVSPPH